MERKELIQSYFSKLSNALLAIYREEFAERGGSDDEMHEMFKEMKKAPKRKKIVFERP